MLTNLSVKNLTLVSELDLDFSPGMTVLTGETGAGKSILLGALGLALGDRADMGLLASGAKRAEIAAEFQLSAGDEQAILWLREQSLDQADELSGQGNVCILRRVLSADGRSRAYINGSPVNVADLKTLGSTLLDIHAQHEHQSLLRKESHQRLLDESGQLQGQVDELNKVFAAWAGMQDELNSLLASRDEQGARMQLLSYQFEELSALAVADEEVPSLEAEQKRLASAVESRQAIDEAMAICSGDENDGTNIKSQLNQALARVANIDDASLANVQELLHGALIQVDEAAQELASLGNRFEPDPERLHQVEERLGSIFDMARKHKVKPDELPALTLRMQEELQQNENTDERIAELETQLAEKAGDYAQLAGKLTKARKKAASKLEKAVTKHLHDLGMAGAAFVIQLAQVKSDSLKGGNARGNANSAKVDGDLVNEAAIDEAGGDLVDGAIDKGANTATAGSDGNAAAGASTDEVNDAKAQAGLETASAGGEAINANRESGEPRPRRMGLDDIEFLVATIPGTAPGSLRKIASGGELSRISLAIQVVTAATSHTPTLVFDEVDSGIGGGTAEVVGQLLNQLGEQTQVLCVTHLPQVAAKGHQHYQVAKSTRDDGASMAVLPLDEKARVNEIARMLGGLEQTEESLAHAEAMLARQ